MSIPFVQPGKTALSNRTGNEFPFNYEEDFNARMRRKMTLVIGLSSGFIATITIGIFKFNWFDELFEFMTAHSEYEDPIVFLTICVLICLVGVLVVYIQEGHRLLGDIRKLIHEREEMTNSRTRHQKLESLGSIASGISHEINTSLQSILGSCEMARTRINDPATAVDFIDKAINSSLYARRIIDNVLTFSANGSRHRIDTCSITSLLSDAAAFSNAFLPRTLRIQVNPPMPDIEIDVDRTGFMQIMNNLVNNAAHAMDYQGTVVLDCSPHLIRKTQADAVGVKAGKYMRFDVIDTGKGISHDDQHRIFDPFFSTKKEGEGTGMGLSIVHGLVRSMGGYIDVQSDLGKGTTMQVHLPQRDD